MVLLGDTQSPWNWSQKLCQHRRSFSLSNPNLPGEDIIDDDSSAAALRLSPSLSASLKLTRAAGVSPRHVRCCCAPVVAVSRKKSPVPILGPLAHRSTTLVAADSDRRAECNFVPHGISSRREYSQRRGPLVLHHYDRRSRLVPWYAAFVSPTESYPIDLDRPCTEYQSHPTRHCTLAMHREGWRRFAAEACVMLAPSSMGTRYCCARQASMIFCSK